jgi:hypothetical protein
MSTTTFHGLGRSAIENIFRPEVNAELCALVEAVPIEQLTTCELIGIVALLRAARDRIQAAGPRVVDVAGSPGGEIPHLSPAHQGPAKLAVITRDGRRTRR